MTDTLRDQILARIDETPHRPPTFTDIARACFPTGHFEGLLDSNMASAMNALFSERVVYTEPSDRGLTFTRAQLLPPPIPRPTARPAEPGRHQTLWCEGFEIEQMAAEYAAGKNIAQVSLKWACSLAKAKACILLGGGMIRPAREIQLINAARMKGVKRALQGPRKSFRMSPENRAALSVKMRAMNVASWAARRAGELA